MKTLLTCLLIALRLCAFSADFDYVFVGSSPICLIEALYRSHMGSKVLILEAEPDLGGAWKSINICGIKNVDMGCHQIGADPKLRKFLEERVGCCFVPMNNPHKQKELLRSSDHGIYFSKGCHELVNNLEKLISKSSILLLKNHRLESVYLDFDRSIAIVKSGNKHFTTSKLVVTPSSYLEIENFPNFPKPSISKHYHLYLLIEDETPERFTYYNGFCAGMSRSINVTSFSAELRNKRQQLIAIQTHDQNSLNNPQFFMDELKKQQLIASHARLILSESYIYQQAHLNQSSLQNFHPKASSFFEILGTDAIWNIARHVDKWEKAFPPYYSIAQ